jgi:multiple sugar transport system ATP-binding protein
MASVSYSEATCRYPGAPAPAVENLTLDVADGEFMVIVGPSGCGKSTSLRMLAGLEPVTSGKIYVDGRDVTDTPPRERDIAMVFQSYALYPHMTVAANIGFPLKVSGVDRQERHRRVHEAASLLGLTEYLDRKPRALSGGQRQRVAMGRAIVRDPQVFCMDEPLSNLDAKLRVSTRAHVASLQRRLGTTTVYVTHDQVEAMTMGDRVAVLDHGVLQQVDTPRALYHSPGNLFVAGFIGSPAMNLFDATATEAGVDILGHTSHPPRQSLALRGTPLTVGVRPEDLHLVDKDQGIPLRVILTEELGADAYLSGRTGANGAASAGDGQVVSVRIAARSSVTRGDTVWVRPDPDRLHLFTSDTGRRIN